MKLTLVILSVCIALAAVDAARTSTTTEEPTEPTRRTRRGRTTETTTEAWTTTTETPSSDFVCPPIMWGTFPDPDQCNGFYMCVLGYSLRVGCPSGLAFNPSAGACDWGYNVPECEL